MICTDWSANRLLWSVRARSPIGCFSQTSYKEHSAELRQSVFDVAPQVLQPEVIYWYMRHWGVERQREKKERAPQNIYIGGGQPLVPWTRAAATCNTSDSLPAVARQFKKRLCGSAQLEAMWAAFRRVGWSVVWVVMEFESIHAMRWMFFVVLDNARSQSRRTPLFCPFLSFQNMTLPRLMSQCNMPASDINLWPIEHWGNNFNAQLGEIRLKVYPQHNTSTTTSLSSSHISSSFKWCSFFSMRTQRVRWSSCFLKQSWGGWDMVMTSSVHMIGEMWSEASGE